MAPGLALDVAVPMCSSPLKRKAARAAKPEPLLEDNPDRFCMFPIKYQSIWEMYKKAEASFWTGATLDTQTTSPIVGLRLLTSLRFATLQLFSQRL